MQNSYAELYEAALEKMPADINTRKCVISSEGALCSYSGLRTGRSPKDKRTVLEEDTKEMWWGDVNIPLPPASFDILSEIAVDYINSRR